MKEGKQILTEDIIEQCREHESEARQEIFERLDMTIEFDLTFVLAERVFYWFADNEYYEEPCLDDIMEVVEKDYFKSRYL